MPRSSDDPTLYVPKASAAFRRANPDVFGKAQGDLDTTRRLGAIELRAEAIKQRFYDHFERHQDLWIATEALKLAADRTYPTLNHPAPKGFGPTPSRSSDLAELMMTKARQNVHARAIGRVMAINTIKTSLQNALVRNTPRPIQAQAQAQARTASNDHQPPTKLRQGGP